MKSWAQGLAHTTPLIDGETVMANVDLSGLRLHPRVLHTTVSEPGIGHALLKVLCCWADIVGFDPVIQPSRGFDAVV